MASEQVVGRRVEMADTTQKDELVKCATCRQMLPKSMVNIRISHGKYRAAYCKMCVCKANAASAEKVRIKMRIAADKNLPLLCSICKVNKPVSEFVTGQCRYVCADCRWQDRCNKPFDVRIACIKKRATVRGLPFSIDAKFLSNLWTSQGGKCAYSGLPMRLAPLRRTPNHRFGDPYAFSVDRVVCATGYVPGNVVLCCNAINIFKGKMPMDTVVVFAKSIARHARKRRAADG